MEQNWNLYTTEDHAVWNILHTRQVQNLQGKAWQEFLDCIPMAGILENEVPDFKKVESALAKSTGWTIEVVAGLIPVNEFVGLLDQKRFCSSAWLRKRHQLDYLEEPDMFHDTFGHMPLLANDAYTAFLSEFAKLAILWQHDADSIKLLERLYWFTIEFGLTKVNGKTKIYGAGLLSSFSEANHVFTDKVEILPFEIERILGTPFKNNEIQNKYFILENMDQLWQCLTETNKYLGLVANSVIDKKLLRLEEQVGSMMA
jgi:phenylalanine-4-hydroxylase